MMGRSLFAAPRGAAAPLKSVMRIAIGECELDIDARRLYRDRDPVHLSPKAFTLLELLAEQRPRAISKQELIDHLWPDTIVVDANLAVLIREIRTALGDTQHRWIRTVHRHGYACADEAGAQRVESSAHVLLRGEREYLLQSGENLVGRNPKAAVWTGATSVSREHATITIDGARATVADLKSKNGTRLNGEPVVEPCLLEDGSVITFGSVEVTYRSTSGLAPTDTSF